MKTRKMNLLKVIAHFTFLLPLWLLVSCSGQEGTTQENSSTQVAQTKVKPPQTDLHTAVLTDNREAVQQHIAAGSNLNEKDPFGGSSPLITASLFDKPEMARTLMDAGADLDFQNNDGATALHIAAFFCRPEIVKMLLEKGADKTIRNKYGVTAYESVAAPFGEAKNTYQTMETLLGPMGLTLDYAYLEKTRPEIAAMLK